MKKITILVVGAFLVGFLGLPMFGFAQEVKSEAKADVKISTPILLPTSPFYFIKEFGRAVQTFFTFNAEKRAELKLRITEEKLVEAQVVSEKQPDNQKGLERALANYEENRAELKVRLEKLQETSKNPNIGDLIQKIDEKIATHTELFNQLIIKSGKQPEVMTATFTGALEASGPSIQMVGTHILSVTEGILDVIKLYRVQAKNDNVLNQLRKYEGQRVTIRGTVTYMNLEGGFWSLLAEEVMAPGISNQNNEKKELTLEQCRVIGGQFIGNSGGGPTKCPIGMQQIGVIPPGSFEGADICCKKIGNFSNDQANQTFTGLLEASGIIFQQWGTHKLSVEQVVYCITAPCSPILNTYLVKAANDNVLADLKKYENQNVSISGEAKYYDLEGGFWGIVAESVRVSLSPSPTSTSAIKVISPKSEDIWMVGHTYEIKWTGGSDEVSIYLTDKSLESQSASISKSWSIDNVKNIGSYKFTVPIGLRGTYRFNISDREGNYAYSDYFTILIPRD